MKVKRYLVGDLPEAVQMIRHELGSDAVILNTKEIRTGGFLGMFRKKQVEVIAAVDESTRRTAPRSLPSRSAQTAQMAKATVQPNVQSAQTQSQAHTEETVPIPRQAVRQLYAQGKPELAADTNRTAVSESPAEHASVAVSEPPPPTAVERTEPPPDDAAETNALMQELRAMKDMMVKMARQQSFRSMPESVLKWSRRLAEQGVEPVHVEQFAEEVHSRIADVEEPEESVSLQAAREVLRSWLIPCAGGGIARDTRIVYFVGPTGVGKTTTIAKLAAEQSLAHRKSVGFITADTYRISAVDQLRTYADILNVPLEVVFSPGELTRAYRKLSDRDLLFMDTAGRNYRNELYVSEVNSLLAAGDKSETMLVLSLTHKYADMRATVSQFAKYGIRRLLLTKADETDTYGAIINLVREFSFPISYITCGQTVPDDIRTFDPEEWVNKLLGESADE